LGPTAQAPFVVHTSVSCIIHVGKRLSSSYHQGRVAVQCATDKVPPANHFKKLPCHCITLPRLKRIRLLNQRKGPSGLETRTADHAWDPGIDACAILPGPKLQLLPAVQAVLLPRDRTYSCPEVRWSPRTRLRIVTAVMTSSQHMWMQISEAFEARHSLIPPIASMFKQKTALAIRHYHPLMQSASTSQKACKHGQIDERRMQKENLVESNQEWQRHQSQNSGVCPEVL